MKIVFFGTPYFAATNLKELINAGHDIARIVCPPDSKKGRGKQLKPCAVKEVGIAHNIPVLQPLKLRDIDFINNLKSLDADIFVVVAFRMLPQTVWDLPRNGTINLHTSLLPNYRGAAPINWVLINGEKETGITTFFIDQQIDSGAIIKQEKIKLTETTTAAELHNTLMHKGSELLINTLESIKKNTVCHQKQESNLAISEAPKITKELLKIDWNKSANEIHNLVRGLSPYLDNNTKLKDIAICPSAWFILKDDKGIQRRIKLHLSKVISNNSNKLLSIETDNKSYFHINTNKNAIAILNLQAEGKNPMTIQQFLQGNKVNKNFLIS
tara:strand:+ start:2605 stop:3585 length:981 start_codon:yes stop_codon:yes gene_type:complete